MNTCPERDTADINDKHGSLLRRREQCSKYQCSIGKFVISGGSDVIDFPRLSCRQVIKICKTKVGYYYLVVYHGRRRKKSINQKGEKNTSSNLPENHRICKEKENIRGDISTLEFRG